MGRLKYQLNSLPIALMHLPVLLTFFSIFFIFPAHAADVTAPSKDNSYKLTLQNVGSVDMEDVEVKPTVVKQGNPIDDLIVFTGVTPSKANIVAGGTQEFDIKFDVKSPTECSKAVVPVKFNFEIKTPTTSKGPFYQKDCGVGQDCQNIKADVNVSCLYTVSVSPKMATLSVENKEYVTHTITIKSYFPEEHVFNIELIVRDPSSCLILAKGPMPSSVTIPANGTGTSQFVVQAAGKLVPGDNLLIDIVVTVEGITSKTWVYDNNMVEYTNDHPDETYDIADPSYPGKYILSDTADTAILMNGFPGAMAHFLGLVNEPISFALTDLSLLGVEGRSIFDYPVLIIPSGGLYGLDGSATFKVNLAEYVKNGGTLIVFSQQHGYEFNVLPGGVSGYGWLEDQSCQWSSTYIDTYHQILSGQDSAYTDFFVDGYFTKWPENSTLLLRRTKNGMPAMLMYEYGQGRVIATTIYEDWGYTYGQFTEDGRRLIRDLLSWAKDPKVLPEFSPGNDVNLTFSVTNNSGTDAFQVKLKVLNPDKEFFKEESIQQSVSTGETVNISYLIPSIPFILGIWHVNYSLLDANGNEIQPELPGERFVVSDPQNVPVIKNITFGITTDTEYYPAGSDVIFTIHIWNNTDTARTITAKTPDWLKYILNKTVTVPANDEVSFTYTAQNIQWAIRLWVHFYDENGSYLGLADKGVWAYTPSVEVKIKTEKEQYIAGEDVSLTLSLTNKQNQAYTSTINLIVLDHENMKIFEKNWDIALSANALATENVVFTLPAGSMGGAYIVRAEAFNNGNKIGSGSTYFQVPETYLGVIPVIPGIIQLGNNTISFNLDNMALVDISAGILEVSLKDPDGTIMWTESKGFDLKGGLSTSLVFTMPINTTVLGNYKLTYKATYNEKTIEGEKKIPCVASINVNFDKASYRVRENLGLEITLLNNGAFSMQNLSIDISVPAINFSSTTNVTLAPNQSEKIYLSPLIPSATQYGLHNVVITLSLGNSMSKNFSFVIDKSKLQLSLDKKSYSSGDTAGIHMENTGGVDTTARYALELIDVREITIYGTNGSLDVASGGSGEINFVVPGSAISGKYRLGIETKDLVTGEVVTLWENIEVDGLGGDLNVSTDKEVYLWSDSKNALADITSTGGDISNSSLNLKVLTGVSMDDDFDEDTINTNRWEGDLSNLWKDFVFQNDGELIFSAPSGQGSGSTVYPYLSNIWPLVGNFDVQVEILSTNIGVPGLTGSGSPDNHIGLAIAGETIWANVSYGVLNNGQPEGNRRWFAAFRERNQGEDWQENWHDYGEAPTSVTNGYLRIKRVGSTISTYYKDEDTCEWTLLSSYDSGTEPVRAMLYAGIREIPFLGAFNNFRVRLLPANYGQTDNIEALINSARAEIEAHNISEANQYYKQALALDAENTEANFGTAITDLANLINNDNIQSIYKRFGGHPLICDLYGPDKDIVFPDPLPIDAPTATEMQGVIGSDILPVIDKAIGLLGDIETKSPGSQITISPAMINYALPISVELDAADIYLIDGILRTVKGVLNMALAHNLDVVDYNTIHSFKDILDQNPDFLTYKADGKAKMQESLGLFVSAAEKIQAAETSMKNEADLQYNDLIKYSGTGDWSEIENIIKDVKELLTGPKNLVINEFGDTWALNIPAFFNNTNGTRYYMPEFDVEKNIIPGTFPDPTFNGALPNATQEWLDHPTPEASDGYPFHIEKDELAFISSDEFTATEKARQAIWEKNIPVNVIGQANISTPIELQLILGNYDLEGTLYSNLSQIIAFDSSSFQVVGEGLYLTFKTDKSIYKPREVITITGKVQNESPIAMSNLNLILTADNIPIYSETFSLASGESRGFTFTTTGTQVFTLTGKVHDVTVSQSVLVEEPKVDISVTAPEIAGREPFDIDVLLKNISGVQANLTVTISGESADLIIPAGESRMVQKNLSITGDTTIDIVISGDVNKTIQKQILFGEAVQIVVSPESAYPEGMVSIPYTISNTGKLDSKFDLTFTLNSQSTTKTVSIPAGKTLPDTLNYNLSVGEYTLSYSSFFGSGSAMFKVAKSNQLEMSLAIGYATTPSVLILKDNATEGDFNTILTDAGMNVTVAPVYEYEWNGTNPSPDDFNVVVLLDGNTYEENMPVAGQEALLNFVNAGGGLIMTEWVTYENAWESGYTGMSDLLLYEPSQWTYANGEETFTIVQEHPITAGLPPSFSVPYHAGNTGGVKPDATVIVSGSMLPSAVAVKQYGAGRIAQFAVAGNYIGNPFISSPDMQKLLVNSVNWAAKALEKNKIRAEVIVRNVGYNNFEGQLMVITDFFADTPPLTLNVGETKAFTYDFDPTYVEPGTYNITTSALHSGNVVRQVTGVINIPGAEFKLTSSPTNPVYVPGQEATMTFKVKNTGMVEGETEVRLTVIDLLDETRNIWIAPGMEEEIDFTFQIPDDLPEKEYNATLELDGEETEIQFLISGVKISVAASLDKSLYNIGDTAILTLNITNEGSLYPEMYARTSSNSYEDIENFTLSDYNTIQLPLPIDEFTQDKISYGIYLASGRAVYLNSIFIRVKKDIITLYTDKDVYSPGETVTVFVETAESGELVVSAPGYENTIVINGSTSFSFVLPGRMLSGTYYINFQFGEYAGVCRFDVRGYSARVLEVTLNKATYDPIDTIKITLNIEVNQDLSGILKGWIYSPDGVYSDLFEIAKDFKVGENKVEITANLATSVDGVHRVVYALYEAYSLITLVSGAEYFDVRQAAITSLTTSKTTYSEKESVIATLKTYACREYTGQIDLFINGSLNTSHAVTLLGEGEVSFDLGLLPAGEYILIARLHADEVISEKQVTFNVSDIAAPAKPTGLTLRIEGSTIILSWNANTETDLAGYNVYKNGNKLNALPLNVTAYRDEDIISGIEYQYYVTAVDEDSNESEPSEGRSTTLDNIPPVITVSPSTDVNASVPITVIYSVTDNRDPSPVVTANYPSPAIFNKDGIYTVTVEAQDHSGNRSSKSITITLILNQPPTVQDLTVTTKEDTAVGVTLTGSDPDGDSLTFSIVNGPLNGTLSGTPPDLIYSPNLNFNGSDSFTYKANDGELNSNIATVNVMVNAVNDAPVASVDLPSQTVQYSDTVTPVTITARDVDSSSLSAHANLPAGLSLNMTNCTSIGGSTNCNWTIEGQALVGIGTYDIKITVSDGELDRTAETSFSIVPEDAEVAFDSENPVAVQVAAPGGNTGMFSLKTYIWEIDTPEDNPGDINIADVEMSLVPVGPGSGVLPVEPCTRAVYGTGYDAVLQVMCSFNNVAVNTYTLQADIHGNYYSGYGEDVLVVYDPSLGFATGGGWFYWPGTDNSEIDYLGDRTNFGFTMKYTKKFTNLQGSLLIIRHLQDGSIYRVKSNALYGLALGENYDENGRLFGWASFSGKATYIEPGWPEPVGNHEFVVYVEDHNEPGSGVDGFWIQVKDKDRNLVGGMSLVLPATSNAEQLKGGNIVVPHR